MNCWNVSLCAYPDCVITNWDPTGRPSPNSGFPRTPLKMRNGGKKTPVAEQYAIKLTVSPFSPVASCGTLLLPLAATTAPFLVYKMQNSILH